MPRKPRIKTQTNTYHVILRGVNRQQIFYDTEDYLYFKNVLVRYKTVCGYHLYAYCLMGNHVHLLIRTGEEPLEQIMKRIGTAYVYWYNSKYQRTGHLFQDRYRSEIIESERSFMVVLRYILRNPVKAGICRFPEEYPYSSGAEYILSKEGISDKESVLNMMDVASLKAFILETNSDQCMEEAYATPPKRCTDAEAARLIIKEFGLLSPTVGKPKERKKLNCSIRKLLSSGISIRQLSRLTGISKRIIESSRE